MHIDIGGDIREGTFIKRLNRFVAEILVDNTYHLAHVPNTGRMKELLVKGARIIIRKVRDDKRKTKYDLLMVYHRDILVCIDSKLPNYLLYKAFYNRELDIFNGYIEVKKEITYGSSRLDIGLIGDNKNTLIEAKCVTYVKDGVAMFPDAPTIRGTKHVNELIKAREEGFESGIIFVIQRNDANIFKPNYNMDKDFSKAIKLAYDNGVKVKAFICDITPNRISLIKDAVVKIDIGNL